ncbi:MAG: hypothetical protein KDD56_03760 [Bdellovibrionales bacterium]|nr:hypothetical protein [Bdellovibrionales bacterium]
MLLSASHSPSPKGSYALSHQELRDLYTLVGKVVYEFEIAFKNAHEQTLPRDLFVGFACISTVCRDEVFDSLKKLNNRIIEKTGDWLEGSKSKQLDYLRSLFLLNVGEVLNLEKHVIGDEISYRMREQKTDPKTLIVETIKATVSVKVAKVSEELPKLLADHPEERKELNCRAFLRLVRGQIAELLKNKVFSFAEAKPPAKVKNQSRKTCELSKKVLESKPDRKNMLLRFLGAKEGALDLLYVFALYYEQRMEALLSSVDHPIILNGGRQKGKA